MAISLKTVIRCSTNACLSSFTQRKRRNLICGAMLVLSLAATHHVVGQDSSPVSTAESKTTEHALQILSGSTQFIEAAPAFSVRGNSAGELMMDNGQLVEYGTNFTAIFVRPAKLYLQFNSRDGSEAMMIFDGETITAASNVDGQHIYDTTPQRGDVTASLDFMSRQTGGSREMAYFLTEQLTKSLDEVQTGLSLGKSTINGVVCDHLVLRSETRDGQVWIARGDKPTPLRILITHRDKPSQPRFWVQFEEWQFSPEISESTFKFTPSDDAEKFHYFPD